MTSRMICVPGEPPEGIGRGQEPGDGVVGPGRVLYPLGGYIADKSGRAKLVGFATILYASSFLLFIFAPSWEWIAIGTAYRQFVLFYMPALNAIMADSIPVKARGRVLSLTIAIPEAVRILSPYIGGWLIAEYTLGPAMRIGYTMSFAVAGVVAYIRIKYLKETVKGEPIGWDILKILKASYLDVFSSIKWIIVNMGGYTLSLCSLSSSVASRICNQRQFLHFLWCRPYRGYGGPGGSGRPNLIT